MKTTTQTQENLSELRDFVAHQAVEDAVLPADERRYQAELVTDVLGNEALNPSQIKELVEDYSQSVARHLETERIAA